MAHSCAQVLPNLYIGDIEAAKNLRLLQQLEITRIVNASCDYENFFEGKFEYMRVDVLDSHSSDIAKYFRSVIQFIDRPPGATFSRATSSHAQRPRTLVHCTYGRSRSASLVIAYLMTSRSMGVYQALNVVRRVRPQAGPNVGFMIQLTNLETEILGTPSGTYDREFEEYCTNEMVEMYSCDYGIANQAVRKYRPDRENGLVPAMMWLEDQAAHTEAYTTGVEDSGQS